jgi:hypothetical protein
MTDINIQALDRELKRGTAKLLILSLLDARRRHGYELSKLIHMRSVKSSFTSIPSIPCCIASRNMGGSRGRRGTGYIPPETWIYQNGFVKQVSRTRAEGKRFHKAAISPRAVKAPKIRCPQGRAGSTPDQHYKRNQATTTGGTTCL